MPESPERLKRIQAYASAAGIPLQSFPGVRIKPEDRDTLPPLGVGSTHYKDRTGATFNLGTIGAFLAHRNLMNHIAKAGQGKPGTLIFEDDVMIPPDFYDKLAAVASEIPSDWDFIFLDKMYPNGKMISPHIMKLERDMTTKKNWGIWGFIVRNDSVASKILPILEHMLDIPDHQLNKFADKLNMYLIQPGIVKPDRATASRSVVTAFDRQRGGGNSSPIHVVLAANEMRPTLQALVQSLEKYGYGYTIHGLGQPWQGFPTKMRLYLEGIKEVRENKGDDTLVALLDAFDTITIRPASATATAYKAKPRRMPILFGAEIVCGGNCRRGVLDWYDHHGVKGGTAAVKALMTPFPKHQGAFISSTPIFLNSGMIMGPAAQMETMLTEMIASGEPDDQLAAGDYFMKHMDQVDLDVEELVFRNKIENLARLPDEGASVPSGPAFLHYPGQRTGDQQAHILGLYQAYMVS